MHRLIYLRPGTQRRNDNAHSVLFNNTHVVFETIVAAMNNLIDRKGRRRTMRMSGIVRGDSLRDFAKPIIQQARWPGINAGMAPTMPAQHCAITSFGVLTIKSGDAITGRASPPRISECLVMLISLSFA